MLDPIVTTIEVPCGQQKAFSVFVDEMNSWWPLGRFSVSAMGGASAKSLRIDAKAGGKVVEIGHDDTEHLWGTIKSYDPHDFLSWTFTWASLRNRRALSKCGLPHLETIARASN